MGQLRSASKWQSWNHSGFGTQEHSKPSMAFWFCRVHIIVIANQPLSTLLVRPPSFFSWVISLAWKIWGCFSLQLSPSPGHLCLPPWRWAGCKFSHAYACPWASLWPGPSVTSEPRGKDATKVSQTSVSVKAGQRHGLNLAENEGCSNSGCTSIVLELISLKHQRP